jgi:hypothetical protein
LGHPRPTQTIFAPEELIRVLFGSFDIGDQTLVSSIIKTHHVNAIFHFAGSIVVPDSVRDPLGYYRNNTANLPDRDCGRVRRKTLYFLLDGRRLWQSGAGAGARERIMMSKISGTRIRRSRSGRPLLAARGTNLRKLFRQATAVRVNRPKMRTPDKAPSRNPQATCAGSSVARATDTGTSPPKSCNNTCTLAAPFANHIGKRTAQHAHRFADSKPIGQRNMAVGAAGRG